MGKESPHNFIPHSTKKYFIQLDSEPASTLVRPERIKSSQKKRIATKIAMAALFDSLTPALLSNAGCLEALDERHFGIAVMKNSLTKRWKLLYGIHTFDKSSQLGP